MTNLIKKQGINGFTISYCEVCYRDHQYGDCLGVFGCGCRLCHEYDLQGGEPDW